MSYVDEFKDDNVKWAFSGGCDFGIWLAMPMVWTLVPAHSHQLRPTPRLHEVTLRVIGGWAVTGDCVPALLVHTTESRYQNFQS